MVPLTPRRTQTAPMRGDSVQSARHKSATLRYSLRVETLESTVGTGAEGRREEGLGDDTRLASTKPLRSHNSA